MVSQFACTVKQMRRTSNEDASSTHHPQQHHPNPPSAAPVPLSADFYFAAILLQPMLSHMQSLDAHASDNEVGRQVQGTALTGQAAGAQKGMPKSRKGAKAHKQAAKETKGEPLPWEVAAKGAALLVRLFTMETSQYITALSTHETPNEWIKPPSSYNLEQHYVCCRSTDCNVSHYCR